LSKVIIARGDVTTEEVTDALRQGLAPGFTVLPGMGMNWNPAGGPRPDKPDMIVVGRGSTRLFRAEVTISRGSDQTVLHVIAGGYGLLLRPLNRFWIAERVRRVLEVAPSLKGGTPGSIDATESSV
jgi:hypothetical protein